MTNQRLDTETATTPVSFRSQFLAEYKRRLLHPVTLVTSLCCSVLFAFIGPYNTYTTDPLWFRFLFWAGVVVSSVVLSLFFSVWMTVRFSHKPIWFHSALGGGCFTIVYFLFIWNLLHLLFAPGSIPHPIELFLVIASITGLVYACTWFFSVMVENRVAELHGDNPEPIRFADLATPAVPPTSNKFFSDYKTVFFTPANIATCLIGAALFAAIGPFDAFKTDTYLARFAFWSALVWTTSIVTLAFAAWANLRFTSQPFWFQSATGSVVFSLIYLILIWITLRAIFHPNTEPERLNFSLTTLAVTCTLYVVLWAFAFIIESRIFLHPDLATTQDTLPATAPDPEPEPNPQPIETVSSVQTFLQKIGPKSGTRLIRLAMSDHYIEAHTDTGMHLLYMRFSDAIDVLDSANGSQVHRSHWVNFDEVAHPTKDGSNIMFVMSDGSTVPVSRSRKKALQDRGLI